MSRGGGGDYDGGEGGEGTPLQEANRDVPLLDGVAFSRLD